MHTLLVTCNYIFSSYWCISQIKFWCFFPRSFQLGVNLRPQWKICSLLLCWWGRSTERNREGNAYWNQIPGCVVLVVCWSALWEELITALLAQSSGADLFSWLCYTSCSYVSNVWIDLKCVIYTKKNYANKSHVKSMQKKKKKYIFRDGTHRIWLSWTV